LVLFKQIDETLKKASSLIGERGSINIPVMQINHITFMLFALHLGFFKMLYCLY
jgi:hypothetical protein